MNAIILFNTTVPCHFVHDTLTPCLAAVKWYRLLEYYSPLVDGSLCTGRSIIFFNRIPEKPIFDYLLSLSCYRLAPRVQTKQNLFPPLTLTRIVLLIYIIYTQYEIEWSYLSPCQRKQHTISLTDLAFRHVTNLSYPNKMMSENCFARFCLLI